MAKNIPLSARIVAAVIRLGRASVTQVAAEVGRYVTPARAIASSAHEMERLKSRRGKSLDELIEYGRTRVVGRLIADLASRGRLTRLSRGVYGPPTPRIAHDTYPDRPPSEAV